ncbi:MAG: hypothetical protein K0B01_14010 [Syntrophobacterales bacterium]|nr:hypothetical protein [Syntrophobacterales bacterium]
MATKMFALITSDNREVALEAAGLNVVYVGSVISDIIKDDWAQLTF